MASFVRRILNRMPAAWARTLFLAHAIAAFASTQLLEGNAGGTGAGTGTGGTPPEPGGQGGQPAGGSGQPQPSTPAPGGGTGPIPATGTGSTATPAPGTGAQPTPPTPPQPTDQAPDGVDQAAWAALSDSGKRALVAERAARQTAEQAARDAQNRVQELEGATLSDTERRDRRISELEGRESSLSTTLQDERMQVAFERVGRAAGVSGVAPELLYRLADPAKVTYDADGKPSNVPQMVEELKQQYPSMFGGAAGNGETGGPRPSIDGGATPPPAAGGFDAKGQLARITEQTGIK